MFGIEESLREEDQAVHVPVADFFQGVVESIAFLTTGRFAVLLAISLADTAAHAVMEQPSTLPFTVCMRSERQKKY